MVLLLCAATVVYSYDKSELNAMIAENLNEQQFVNNQFPTIKVIFPEYSNITTVLLYGYDSVQDDYYSIELSQFDQENHQIYYFRPRTTLQEGLYVLIINATDRAGNCLERLKVVPFHVDLTPPELVSTDPGDGESFTSQPFRYVMDFNEPVNLSSVMIGNVDYQSRFVPSSDNMRFTLMHEMNDGYYPVSITVKDLAGNVAIFSRSVIINSNPLKIFIKSPRNGVSNKSGSFDIIIGTDENANCRWSYTNIPYNSMLSTSFYEEITAYKTEHLIKDYDKAQPVENIPNSPEVFVKCKDTLGAISSNKFRFYYDTTPPSINVNAVPNPIVAYDRKTLLKVMSDDRVICRFSNTTQDFDRMELRFASQNLTNFDDYNFSHQTELVYANAKDNVFYSYTYWFRCINLAGFLSELKEYTININLSGEFQIQVESPSLYNRNSRNIRLNVTTNKYANCFYSFDDIDSSPTPMSPSDPATPARHHTALLGDFDEGRYNITIRCYAGTENVDKHYVFYIETTPPVVDSIDDHSPCYTDKFIIKWKAHSKLVPIDHYIINFYNNTGELSYIKTNITVKQDQSKCDNLNCSMEYTITGLNLTVGVKYGVTITPVSMSGRKGAQKASPGSAGAVINPHLDECLEHTPPQVTWQLDQHQGYTTVTLYCQDDSGCDSSRGYYGVTLADVTCLPITLYNHSFNITRNSSVCYRFYDKIGNKAEGSFNVSVLPVIEHCNNGIKDEGETDVDCGGSMCEPCKAGPTCSAGDGCVVGCSPVDPDCGSTGATCSAGDGCYGANCSVPDPDCGHATCSMGDGCLAGCLNDPDCTDATCSAGDKCMIGCNPVDPDCGSTGATCNSGDGCYGGNCVVPDPDCDGATCAGGDICLVGCSPVDPDCYGQECITDLDCVFGSKCIDNHCITPNCFDNIKNQDETDVDCGGSTCKRCRTGPTCDAGDGCVVGCEEVDLDCGSTNATCSAGDGCMPGCPIQDPDCGHATCSAGDGCLAGCLDDPDCIDASCSGGDKCVIGCDPVDPDCGGGTCNPGDGCGGSCDESDIDCGTITCNSGDVCLNGCTNDEDCLGQTCIVDSDCVQGSNCINGRCAIPSCNDLIKDQDETDIDCGGSICKKCENGMSCIINADCKSNYCSGNICQENKNKDSDGDGMPDYWEEKYGLNPNNPRDAALDNDGDKLTNVEEYKLRARYRDSTNPLRKDTDGDGYDDFKEYKHNTNPLDPNDYPRINWMSILLLVLGIILVLIGGGYEAYSYYLYSLAKKTRPVTPRQPIASVQPKPIRKPMPKKPALSPEQLRRLELQRKIYEKHRKEKETERKKFLEKFSVSSDEIKQAASEKPAEKKTARKILFEEEWVPIKKLKTALEKKGIELKPDKNIKNSLENIIKVNRNASIFDKLSSLTKTKEGSALIKKNLNMPDIKEEIHKISEQTSGQQPSEALSALYDILEGKINKNKLNLMPASFTPEAPQQSRMALGTSKIIHEDKIIQEDKQHSVNKSDKKTDVFEELRKITGKEGRSGSVFEELKKIALNRLDKELDNFVAKSDVKNKEDIMQMFATLSQTANKKTVMNVFSTILLSLIKAGKITKQDVYDVMHDLENEGVINNEDVAKVLKDIKI